MIYFRTKLAGHVRIYFFIGAILLGLFVAIGLNTGISRHADATSATDFNPANIISDVIFTNSNTMSANQIQAFLSSKVTNCDTNGTQIATDYGSSLTHAQYAASRGWSAPPYTCLKDYTENNLSSAQIIYNLAQQYQVNPQVLITLLQKEQGLVTDTWPLATQYRSATGYGCPDSSACASTYYGFTNQVTWSAKMFHAIMTQSPNWYSPYVLGSNYIQWNPNSSCGGSNVSIQNLATVALYDYTPYRPNQAALNAGYGLGDSCSAYGNRNFYLYFSDWFGSTTIPYSATYIGQSGFPTLAAGQSVTQYITYRNSGNSTWYDNTAQPTRLATVNPVNRASEFSDASWGTGHNRPATQFDTVYKTDGTTYSSNPHAVLPGESVKFAFTLNVPIGYSGGTYREFFAPVVDSGAGIVPTTPTQTWIDITIPIINTAQWVAQSQSPTLLGGQSQTAYIQFKNTGNKSWYDNQTAAVYGNPPTRLAVVNAASNANASSLFSGGQWGADSNRPTGIFSTVYDSGGSAYVTNPHIVKPGESAMFTYQLQTPDNQSPNQYRDYLAPVIDGGIGITQVQLADGRTTSSWQDITVLSGPSARPQVLTDSLSINPLSSTTAKVYSFKNTGSSTLTSTGTTLNIVSGNNTDIGNSSWLGSQVASLDQASVAPGALGTFTVLFTSTQAKAGVYTLKLDPMVNGSDIALAGIQVTLTVAAPIYNASYYSQSNYPEIAQNSSQSGYFMFKNTGNVLWSDAASALGGTKPVVLAASNPINRISFFNAAFSTQNRPSNGFSAVYESDGTTLSSNQHIAQPGQVVKFIFTITVPQTLSVGTYREYFQPILEGGNPWDIQAIAFLDVTVTGSTYSATYVSQSDYPIMTQGSTQAAYLMLKNTGSAMWHDTISAPVGTKPVVLAATSPINRISAFNAAFASANRPATQFAAVYNSNGTTLAADQHLVTTGQIAKFIFTFTAPQTQPVGLYREYFQPILEGGNPWDMGMSVFLDVTVIK